MGTSCMNSQQGYPSIQSKILKKSNHTLHLSSSTVKILPTDQNDGRKYDVLRRYSKGGTFPLRSSDKAQGVKRTNVISNDSSPMELSISKGNNKFIIKVDSQLPLPEKLWEYKQESVRIVSNDSFIIDATIYKLQKGPSLTELKSHTSLILSQQFGKKKKNENEQNCKICYENETEKENPLVSPCKCQGSIDLIHIQCFKKWLFLGIRKSEGVLEVYVNSQHCEICKTNFMQIPTYKIIQDDITSTSVSLKKYKYHILFEKQTGSGFKSMLFIGFDKKTIHTIGKAKAKGTINPNPKENMMLEMAAALEVSPEAVILTNLGPQNTVFGAGFATMFPVSIPFSQKAPLCLKFGQHCLSANVVPPKE